MSIGTLYNHFPTREDLFDAIFPARMAVLDAAADAAANDPDPSSGFAAFTETLFALHAEDHGLNDALALRVPMSPGMVEACHRCFQHIERLIARAKDAGQLRSDFETTGVAPQAWRRHLAFLLDGLRAGAAHPVAVAALTADQLAAIMTTQSR